MEHGAAPHRASVPLPCRRPPSTRSSLGPEGGGCLLRAHLLALVSAEPEGDGPESAGGFLSGGDVLCQALVTPACPLVPGVGDPLLVAGKEGAEV